MSASPSPELPPSEILDGMETGVNPASTAPPRPGSRHWLSLIIVVVLAIAIVVPPLFNIERYQHRIAANISRSLGRPVHFSHISLHLLPRPGFDLSDFTVDEGPGFGAEPILHSSSVSASVRLLSLWRGRLEVARIALDEPSLNLVRNKEGKWNFASVLTQASLTSVAPTGQAGPGRTLRFPYIEASNARINFKYGDEKQPFSFMNGDLSLWLENPQEWQLRFAAQPIRTDLDLFASNTGLVRIEGSIKRAPALGEVPINLRAEWTRAPIDQIGRLFGGSDPGWRGELDIRSRLSGTPSELLLGTTLQLNDLHRVEFEPEHSLSYAAKCTGTFRKSEGLLSGLSCLLPVDGGRVTVAGTMRVPAQTDASQIDIAIDQLPAASALGFLQLTREQFGRDLGVDGLINGRFTMHLAAGHTMLAGSAAADQLKVTAPSFDEPLALNGIRLTALDTTAVHSAVRRKGKRTSPAVTGPASLLLAPVKIDLGASSALLVDGRFDHHGFLLNIGGRAELARLMPVIRSTGISAQAFEALQPVGEATLDLQLHGPWLMPVDTSVSDGSPLTAGPTGTITLRDAKLETPYLAAPLILKSAQANLTPTLPGGSLVDTPQIAWSGIVAQYGPLHFGGTFRSSLSCGRAVPGAETSAECERQFDITVPSLDLAALPALLVRNDTQLISALLSRIESNSPHWPHLHGTMRVASASLGTLEMDDAVANLDIEGAKVKIESLDAKALDGTLHLSGTLTAGPAPTYRLDAQLSQASVPGLGDLFHQSWGTGAINVAAHFTLTGSTRDELTSSAQGAFHFDWSHGGLHPTIRSPFAHFEQWTADGQLRDSAFNLEQSLLTGSEGVHTVQGTIGFSTQLDLKSTPAPAAGNVEAVGDNASATLSGTLAAPEYSIDAPERIP